MEYFLEAFRKYADFSGRANRREYWWFQVVGFAIGVLLVIPLSVISVTSAETVYSGGVATLEVTGVAGFFYTVLRIVIGLFYFATLIPTIALGVRRLHDTNRSGWWLLIPMVPIVGWIILLVFLFQRGTATDNKYGSVSTFGNQ